jgi:hypothetical protein
LLKGDKPDVKSIEGTIRDLNRFPKDPETRKLIEELTRKRNLTPQLIDYTTTVIRIISIPQHRKPSDSNPGTSGIDT